MTPGARSFVTPREAYRREFGFGRQHFICCTVGLHPVASPERERKKIVEASSRGREEIRNANAICVVIARTLPPVLARWYFLEAPKSRQTITMTSAAESAAGLSSQLTEFSDEQAALDGIFAELSALRAGCGLPPPPHQGGLAVPDPRHSQQFSPATHTPNRTSSSGVCNLSLTGNVACQ